MNQPREPRTTILVPLDGSHYSEAILGTAARLARALGAQAHLLRVVTPADAPMPRPERQAVEASLQRCAAVLNGVAAVITIEFDDDPARVIIDHARREHVALIAMTTHGRTGRLRQVMGRVCAQVLGSGVAPVVLLRP
jgi:nucleotide-binding universal stress UspA family protein